MNKLLSCRYNMDSNRISSTFAWNKSRIAIVPVLQNIFCPRFVVDATIVDRKQEAAEPWPYRFLLIMENENVL